MEITRKNRGRKERRPQKDKGNEETKKKKRRKKNDQRTRSGPDIPRSRAPGPAFLARPIFVSAMYFLILRRRPFGILFLQVLF
jgi:hypothetical protein